MVDGEVALAAAAFTQQPVSLTIGGQPAQIYYAGAAPYEVWGMLQVTAFVPNGLAPGAQPLVLKIGQNDNSAQGVTVAVQ